MANKSNNVVNKSTDYTKKHAYLSWYLQPVNISILIEKGYTVHISHSKTLHYVIVTIIYQIGLN